MELINNTGVLLLMQVFLFVTLIISFIRPRVLFLIFPIFAVLYTPIMDLHDQTITATDLILFTMVVEIFLSKIKVYSNSKNVPYELSKIALIVVFLTLSSLVGPLIYFGIDRFILSLMIILKRFALYLVLPIFVSVFVSMKFLKKCITSYIYFLLLIYIIIVFNPVDFGYRSEGVFFNSNILGIYSVLLFNFSYWILHSYKWTQNKKVLIYLLMALAVLGLAQSASRMSFFAFLASISYIFFKVRNSPINIGLYIFIILFSLIGIYYLGYMETLIDRLYDFRNNFVRESSFLARLELQMIGLQIFKDYPLGIGVGNLSVVGESYFSAIGEVFYDRSLLIHGISTTDNLFTNILVEMGVIAFIINSIFLIYIFRLSSKYSNRFSKVIKVNLIVLTLVALFSNSYFTPFISMFFWYQLSFFIKEIQEMKNEKDIVY